MAGMAIGRMHGRKGHSRARHTGPPPVAARAAPTPYLGTRTASPPPSASGTQPLDADHRRRSGRGRATAQSTAVSLESRCGLRSCADQ